MPTFGSRRCSRPICRGAVNATLRESVHKPADVDRADALDHAGAEVALDAAQVRRRDLDEHGPELPAAVVMAG